MPAESASIPMPLAEDCFGLNQVSEMNPDWKRRTKSGLEPLLLPWVFPDLGQQFGLNPGSE
jgi:hypothetical protein